MHRARETAEVRIIPGERRKPSRPGGRRAARVRRGRSRRTTVAAGAFAICVAGMVMTAMDRATHLGTASIASGVVVTATVGTVPDSALQPLPVAQGPNLPAAQATVRLAPAAAISIVPAMPGSGGRGASATASSSRGGVWGPTGAGTRIGSGSPGTASSAYSSYPASSSGYASPFWGYPGWGQSYGSYSPYRSPTFGTRTTQRR